PPEPDAEWLGTLDACGSSCHGRGGLLGVPESDLPPGEHQPATILLVDCRCDSIGSRTPRWYRSTARYACEHGCRFCLSNAKWPPVGLRGTGGRRNVLLLFSRVLGDLCAEHSP